MKKTIKLHSLVAFSCLCGLFAFKGANAQSVLAPRSVQLKPTNAGSLAVTPKPFYTLQHIHFSDKAVLKSVWFMQADPANHGIEPPVPGGGFFDSLASPTLREWVSHLPPGSSIVAMGWLGPQRNTRVAAPPDQFHLETNDFKRFCDSKNVNFGSWMSGG